MLRFIRIIHKLKIMAPGHRSNQRVMIISLNSTTFMSSVSKLLIIQVVKKVMEKWAETEE